MTYHSRKTRHGEILWDKNNWHESREEQTGTAPSFITRSFRPKEAPPTTRPDVLYLLCPCLFWFLPYYCLAFDGALFSVSIL